MQSQNVNQNASSPKFVDKERLAEAVKLKNDGSSVDFASGIQIQENKLALNSMSVAALGSIQVPVSLLDIKRLKQISKISPYGKGCNSFIDPSIRNALEIEADVLSTTPENLNLHLSSLAARHLCLPPGMMTVEAKLSRLILYETGGHFTRILESEKLSGTFGTATLQVPVEGGHEGGRYQVQYQGREKLFENHQQSDQNFHLLTYYNNCKVSMEPVTRGWKLTLVFDLVWTNAKTLTPPNDLPVFLTSLKEIKAALSPWVPQENDNVESHLTDNSNEMVTQPNSSVTVEERASVNSEEDSDDQSDQEDSDAETDNQSEEDSTSLTTLQGDSRDNNVLFFVLQEKYEEKDLLFRRLGEKDRNLAYLLQSCPFVEVHLAMVVLEKTKQGGDEYGAITCRERDGNCESCPGDLMVHRSVKISRWVDSDDCTRNLSITIDWKEQCVGPIRNLLTSRGIRHDFEDEEYLDCGGTVFLKHYYNAVLVIRPKHQTIFIYCENNIHSLLDRMENSLNSAPSIKKQEIQQKVTSDLQQLITLYCNTRPKGGNKTNRHELTVRLLRLCISLRSRDGLVLLKMLGWHDEGIQNTEVAHAIAEFECKVTGWPDCALLVQRLVALVPERLTRQFVPIIKLAQYLAEVDCIEGAKMVEDLISSSLSNAIDPLAQNLAKMKTQDMCQLFIQVHKASSGCLETYPFYIGIIRHFCQLLSSRLKEIDTVQRDTILKVLKRFVLFGDKSLIHSLLKNLCSVKENTKHVKQNLLQGILSLSTLWSKLDSEIKLMILNTCITLVEAGIAASVCLSSTNQAIHQSNNQVLTSKLLNCAKLFILAEKLRFVPEQKNASLAFQQLFTKLKPIQLLELVLEIHLTESKASPNIKNFPICLEWYRNLSRRLFSQNFLSIVKCLPDYLAKYHVHLCSSDAFKITHCLLWLNDGQSWELFAHHIIESFPSEKCSNFIRVFINDPKCQEDLKDSSLVFASLFTRMIDDMLAKTLKEPTAFTWQQPTAVVPKFHGGMDEVETFLRSTQEKMNFANFVNIHEARSFASKLQQMGPSNGFSVQVTGSGSGRSARCEIAKNRSFYDNVVKRFETAKSELAELIDLRRTIKEHSKGKRSSLENAASSSGHSSSPAKRVKCDVPLVDVSD